MKVQLFADKVEKGRSEWIWRSEEGEVEKGMKVVKRFSDPVFVVLTVFSPMSRVVRTVRRRSVVRRDPKARRRCTVEGRRR